MGSIYWSTMSVILLVLLTTFLYLVPNKFLRDGISLGDEGLTMYSMVNVPQWYLTRDWGLRKHNTNLEPDFIQTIDDAETMNSQILWHNFFFETSHALLLTVGHIPFEKDRAWVRSIMIDGVSESESVSKLRVTHPHALIVRAALCGSDSEKETPCAHLTDILTALSITHFNIFTLSAGGRELEVLRSIDWSTVSFDVVSIETSPNLGRNENMMSPVLDFMTSKGYIVWARELGTNSWFVSPNFIPFKNPELPEPGVMMYL